MYWYYQYDSNDYCSSHHLRKDEKELSIKEIFNLTHKFKLTELKARDTFCPKGKKVEPKRIKAIGI